jgi:hypothetical protein
LEVNGVRIEGNAEPKGRPKNNEAADEIIQV